MKSTVKNIVSCLICLLFFGICLFFSVVEVWYKVKMFFHVHLPLILILLTFSGVCSILYKVCTVLEKKSQKKSKRG